MTESGSQASKGRVLIIEDENIFRMAYQDALINYVYEALTAEDGESGWQNGKNREAIPLIDLPPIMI